MLPLVLPDKTCKSNHYDFLHCLETVWQRFASRPGTCCTDNLLRPGCRRPCAATCHFCARIRMFRRIHTTCQSQQLTSPLVRRMCVAVCPTISVDLLRYLACSAPFVSAVLRTKKQSFVNPVLPGCTRVQTPERSFERTSPDSSFYPYTTVYTINTLASIITIP